MIKVKVGDEVIIECYSGLGTGGPATVTKITDETIVLGKNGSIATETKKVKVIWCGKRAFSAKNGEALNPPWMYYISQ